MNRTPYMGPDRKKGSTNIVFKIAIVVLILLFVLYAFYSCQSKKTSDLDYDNMKLIQRQVPKDDSPVVVFETNLGTYKAVLYPEEAPNYCKYFTDLVNDGYYNDTYAFGIEKNIYFMSGSKTNNGVSDNKTDLTETEIEKSPNLLPLKGALCAYTQESGFLAWKKKNATSYILNVNNYDLTDEEQSQLDENIKKGVLDDEIPKYFEKYGGIMNWVEQYTIFGQVYDGMDIYDKICNYDIKDEETKQPADDIKYTKVYMSTYGENKNNDFFDADEKNTPKDSSSTADSE